MNKKIKILQTPIRFYPYLGGVENHVLYLSEYLIKNGYDLQVVCSNEPKTNIKSFKNIKIKKLSYIGKITNTNISLSLPITLLKTQFDIIHTHMPTPWTADWSVLIAKLKGKKSILTIHNDMDKSSTISKLVTKIYINTVFRITLLLATKIIIVNPTWEKSFDATKNILRNYKKKISVIPNGVDITQFKKRGFHSKNDSILFVSILDKHHSFKGLSYLLAAIKQLHKILPNINLTIVGEGELKKTYLSESKQLGIDKNVTFVGKISQKKLSRYYNNSSIFVLPSFEIEGFGIVLLEALASKLPVITTRVAGVWRDIQKHNAGIIVEKKNAKSIANALLALINEKNKRINMGQNGYTLIKSKYTWSRVSSQVDALYKEVLN